MMKFNLLIILSCFLQSAFSQENLKITEVESHRTSVVNIKLRYESATIVENIEELKLAKPYVIIYHPFLEADSNIFKDYLGRGNRIAYFSDVQAFDVESTREKKLNVLNTICQKFGFGRYIETPGKYFDFIRWNNILNYGVVTLNTQDEVELLPRNGVNHGYFSVIRTLSCENKTNTER